MSDHISATTADLPDVVPAVPKVISPAAHAVLDYGVAASFFVAGAMFHGRNRAASTLAFLNGAMVLGMSLLTDYPGGIKPVISFRGHRTGDIAQAALAGFGPTLFGFADRPEATFFHAQAMSEMGVIAATDWDGVEERYPLTGLST
jgi:hypothetical protein